MHSDIIIERIQWIQQTCLWSASLGILLGSVYFFILRNPCPNFSKVLLVQWANDETKIACLQTSEDSVVSWSLNVYLKCVFLSLKRPKIYMCGCVGISNVCNGLLMNLSRNAFLKNIQKRRPMSHATSPNSNLPISFLLILVDPIEDHLAPIKNPLLNVKNWQVV